MLGMPVDVVFVGSCTNSRMSDLYAPPRILQGPQGREVVRMLVVPGSQQVQASGRGRRSGQGVQGRRRRMARSRLLDVPRHEWRHRASRDSICVSTSNRNFEGRQGVGARTVLASPLTRRGGSAVAGVIADPRPLLPN
jgi:3-isopropylmalate/(R)-2-methylmalate dehydratase large subunit